ncbi:5-oxoprolinase subunit B family protein [Tautonia rosea]|uniref:5-oxoprolinase subunit B family protein n=1 Tax=Tautonia rosea TaxID=2728037 RepID=UPI001473CFA6|nr:allophanate hydrolase subunit 1 [Tautonia rosea]
MTNPSEWIERGLTLEPFGDRAWLARFPTDACAAAWAEAVRNRSWPGVVEVVAVYRSVAIFVDPSVIDPGHLELLLRCVPTAETSQRVGQRFRVPVLYDGEDLEAISKWIGLPMEEIIANHTAVEYSVRAIGFLPGFPYLGELSEPLIGLPRRATPRTQVPAGAVAIAGQQSCIYPEASPGGWHLIGRTPLIIADLSCAFFPIETGDRVQFDPINHRQYQQLWGCRLGEF